MTISKINMTRYLSSGASFFTPKNRSRRLGVLGLKR